MIHYNLFNAFFLFSAPLTAVLVADLFIAFDPAAFASAAPLAPPGASPRPSPLPAMPILAFPATFASAVDSGAGDVCRSFFSANPEPSRWFSVTDFIDIIEGYCGAGDGDFREMGLGKPSLLVVLKELSDGNLKWAAVIVEGVTIGSGEVAFDVEATADATDVFDVASSEGVVEPGAVALFCLESASELEGVSNSTGLVLGVACTLVMSLAREQ